MITAAGHTHCLLPFSCGCGVDLALTTKVTTIGHCHLAETKPRTSAHRSLRNISIRYLYKLFERKAMSPEQWIIDAKAPHRPCLTSRPTRPIASVGFSDPSFFSSRFGQQAKLTPVFGGWRPQRRS